MDTILEAIGAILLYLIPNRENAHWWEYIPALTAAGGIVTLIICLFIYFPDFWKAL